MYLQLVVLNVKSDFVWILFQIPSEVEKLFNDPCAINLSPEVIKVHENSQLTMYMYIHTTIPVQLIMQ